MSQMLQFIDSLLAEILEQEMEALFVVLFISKYAKMNVCKAKFIE
jgi:hypothetical protein